MPVTHPGSAMRLPALLLLLSLVTPLAAAPYGGAPFAPYKGDPLPSFTLPDLDGTPWSLEAARGQVVVVNFWATWCPPCVAEMPALDRLQKKFADQPLKVVAVNVGEEPYDVALFLRQVPLDLLILLDGKGQTSKQWNARGLPTTVVVDAEGRVRHHIPGMRNWDSEAVAEALRALLPDVAPPPALQRAAAGG